MPTLECGCVYDGTKVVFKKCDRHTDEALLGSVGLLLSFHWVEGLKPVGDADVTELDKFSVLKGTVEIAGVDFHIEAWELKEIEAGGEKIQATASSLYTDSFEGICGDFYVGENAVQTVKINGRNYFLIITPYAR